MTRSKIRQIFLLLVDILILLLSLYLSLGLRYLNWPSKELWNEHLFFFIPVFFVCILILYINSLYDLRKFINQSRIIEQVSKSVFFSFLLTIIIFYLIPNRDLSPKTILVIFSLISYAFLLLWRLGFSLLNKNYLPTVNVAIIGYNEVIRKTIKTIKRNKNLGYEIKFILSETNNVLEDIVDHYGLILIEDVNQLSRAIKMHKINVLILEKDISEMKGLQKTLFNLLPSGINYCTLSKFYEEISGQIPIEILNKGWFLENLNLADKRNFERIKRLYDLGISGLMLILSLPFWPIIMLAIKIDSPGPIIFKQIRVGKNGKNFKFLKFRTMRVEDNTFKPTTTNDKRITRFGKFMRQTRIDELPQLINVLKGEMSFVGPRPERPELIKNLSQNIPFYNIRNLIKPGITGWDQISGEYHSPSIEDTYKKLQYDLYYIKNRSTYLDISIILKTIRTALGREGL
ncbi:MAG: sugar transferase [Patescibacteria group bacterium]|jgi:exopolysaccharide biosynthesis polyprenyl glycosylphosphotransferase